MSDSEESKSESENESEFELKDLAIIKQEKTKKGFVSVKKRGADVLSEPKVFAHLFGLFYKEIQESRSMKDHFFNVALETPCDPDNKVSIRNPEIGVIVAQWMDKTEKRRKNSDKDKEKDKEKRKNILNTGEFNLVPEKLKKKIKRF